MRKFITSKIVVVGAGLAGAATAWRLAANGHEVTIVERFAPANAHGSSHGSARIFRYAYSDPFYTWLVAEARGGWDELERQWGSRLIEPSGALDHGQPRNPRLLADNLVQVGVEHELLTAVQATNRWPMFAFDTEVLWHPGAGIIDAETSVSAMIKLAAGFGARILNDWQLASVMRSAAGYRLTSATGDVIDAERLVVCAGGWLPDLLSELPLPEALLRRIPTLQVRQEQAFHFSYRDETNVPGSWPTFMHKSTNMQTYGLPGGRDAGFYGQKVAEYNGGKLLSSAASQDGVISEPNRERVKAYIATYLPGLVPEPYAETTCLFTSTPTEDFILDTHDNVTVVSPCSGHGAKFAPLIGSLAAGLATGAGSAPDRFRTFKRAFEE